MDIKLAKTTAPACNPSTGEVVSLRPATIARLCQAIYMVSLSSIVCWHFRVLMQGVIGMKRWRQMVEEGRRVSPGHKGGGEEREQNLNLGLATLIHYTQPRGLCIQARTQASHFAQDINLGLPSQLLFLFSLQELVITQMPVCSYVVLLLNQD